MFKIFLVLQVIVASCDAIQLPKQDVISTYPFHGPIIDTLLSVVLLAITATFAILCTMSK